MDILVRESVPAGFATLGAAHASLACYLRFRDAPEVTEWLAGPFYKVVCRVTDAEFDAAKVGEDSVVVTESALGSAGVAVAFRPRGEWPKSFGFFKAVALESRLKRPHLPAPFSEAERGAGGEVS